MNSPTPEPAPTGTSNSTSTADANFRYTVAGWVAGISAALAFWNINAEMSIGAGLAVASVVGMVGFVCYAIVRR